MESTKNTESRTIRLPDITWAKLRKMADRQGRTVGNLVRHILIVHTKTEPK